MKKIIVSVITFMMIIVLFSSTKSYAMSEFTDSGDSFLNIGKSKYNENKPLDEGALQKTSGEIYNILFTIGAVLAIGVGLVIGIQFITGSVDEKAKIKETLIPYVVGCLVIFSAFTIWKIVIELGTSVENTTAQVREIQDENKFLTFS